MNKDTKKSNIHINFYIRGTLPEQVKAEFEEACRMNGQDMTAVLNQLIREYVRKKSYVMNFVQIDSICSHPL